MMEILKLENKAGEPEIQKIINKKYFKDFKFDI